MIDFRYIWSLLFNLTDMKLKTAIISLALICFFAMTSFARELTKNEKTAIANLKDNVRNGRVDSVAEQVEYPQCRSAFPEYTISQSACSAYIKFGDDIQVYTKQE